MFLFTKNNHPEYEPILIFDVGSGSVAGAIVLIFKDSIPQIIYSARESIKFNRGSTEANLLAGKHAALSEVVKRIQDDGLPVLHSVAGKRLAFGRASCFLASPWQHCRTSQVGLSRKGGFVLSPEKLDELLSLEEEKIFKEMNKGSSLSDKDIKIIDKRIQSCTLDGYKVAKIIGRKCERFEMNLFQSAVYRETIENIGAGIHRYFNVDDVDFHSFTLAFSDTVRHLRARKGSYLLMDITGQVTDIYIVRQGEIRDCLSLPFGKHTLIRGVAKKMSVSPSVAHSSVKIYLAGKGDQQFRNSFEGEMIELQEKWRELFREVMSQIFQKYLTPRDLVLTTDRDTAPFFMGILETEKPAMSQIVDDHFNVQNFSVEHVTDLCGFGRFKSEPDPFLGIEANFEAQVRTGPNEISFH